MLFVAIDPILNSYIHGNTPLPILWWYRHIASLHITACTDKMSYILIMGVLQWWVPFAIISRVDCDKSTMVQLLSSWPKIDQVFRSWGKVEANFSNLRKVELIFLQVGKSWAQFFSTWKKLSSIFSNSRKVELIFSQPAKSWAQLFPTGWKTAHAPHTLFYSGCCRSKLLGPVSAFFLKVMIFFL